MHLFEPLELGALRIPNRIILSPLTRSRAGESRVPNELMKEYYRQRASAGLMITEATVISRGAVGYRDTPGIWNDEQVYGWRKITESVHEAGGRIFLQLWHVGRISHPILLDGELPVAPSAIAPGGRVSLVRPATLYVVPRELSVAEIKAVVEDFRRAAENAQRAGFDGVELHGANGYLIDQFLQDSSNRRTDEYGGSIDNRLRFLLEVTDAVTSVWGADRVGVHLAPRGDSHSMGDSDLRTLFLTVAQALGERKLAFLCAREARREQWLSPEMKKAFGGVFIGNEGFDRESAEEAIAAGDLDAVAFGRLFLANPDLPKRFQLGATLNEPDPTTFYAGGAKGYTDYPSLDALEGEA